MEKATSASVFWNVVLGRWEFDLNLGKLYKANEELLNCVKNATMYYKYNGGKSLKLIYVY